MRLLTILLATAPTFALAQQNFTPPAGCEGRVTVQQKNCIVSNHFTCEGDEDGDTQRADFDQTGLVYAGKIDREAQWIQSFYPQTGGVETLEDDPFDAASFSELLTDGGDDYDFVTVDLDGARSRFVGRDELTGEERVIDGETLKQTRYDIRMYNPEGEVTWRSAGEEFIHPEWRVFLSGVGTSWYAETDEEVIEDGTPVEFIFEGEDGYLSSEPKYGCNAVDASWSAGR